MMLRALAFEIYAWEREGSQGAWRGACSAVQCSRASQASVLAGLAAASRLSRVLSLSHTHTHTATDETKPVYCMRPRLGYLGWLSVFLLLLSSKF